MLTTYRAFQRRSLLALITSAGLLIPGQASAACVDNDLPGTYQIYALTQSIGNAAWTRCRLEVGSSGAITPGTSCEQRDVFGSRRVGEVQGGSLSIAANCKVTGVIRIFGRNTVRQAWMNRGKDIIEGVGLTRSGSIINFSAVKR